ncbi:HEAT repeat domain-containing protein [Gordonia rhizosphera]|uniref:Putative MerR family transcriptional regulator n=1 Tax=Gordonia rhizosphera NBRC 16068 TaxID=1108045 RepID=K6W8G2_9ACTN|nr:HEAT repeat domain-containing protein [Gordonia rhizosphera]GAB90041.1 putative MerR family transcriptional regulator [Gordonia rhizosphera NBRC 16068]
MLIGEVSRRSGVSTRMLRHYDRLGLLTPTGRTSGGYREYSGDDIRRLFHIESLRTLGLTLPQVKSALDDPEFSPSALVADLIDRTRKRIADERELLGRLRSVDASSPAGWEEVLAVLTLFRALESSSAPHRQQAVLSQPADGPVPVDELVKAVLAEDDPNVAGALRWSLARAGEQALPALGAGLDSSDVEVRRRAVAAITDLDVDGAVGLLRGAVSDADDTVRERAALGLAAHGDRHGFDVLVEMVIGGHHDVEAAEALGHLGGADAVAALGDRLGPADPATRLRIVQALAEIGDPTARTLLAALTGDADRTVAATAAAILT